MTKVCPGCGGEKTVEHAAHYTLDVEKGCPEGKELLYEGEGDESPDWEAGDVIIKVRSKKEKGGFRRKEGSLYWKETIGIDEVRFCAHSLSLGKKLMSVAGSSGCRAQYYPSRRTHCSTNKKRCHSTWLVASLSESNMYTEHWYRFRRYDINGGYASLRTRNIWGFIRRIQCGVTYGVTH